MNGSSLIEFAKRLPSVLRPLIAADINVAITKATAPLEARIALLEARIAELDEAQPKYLGVWREGTTYARNAIVTHRGVLWWATSATPDRPGHGPTAWILCDKEMFSRDGRDAMVAR